MAQLPARLYVDGFLLKISDSAYLIRVEQANGNTARYVKPAHLPDWIFRSSHAIWLTQDNGTLIDRARRGDEIRERIRRSIVRNK